MTSVPLGLSTLLALAALSAFTALTTLFLTGRRFGPAEKFAEEARKSSVAVFLMNSDRLIRANPAARAFLGEKSDATITWASLAAALAAVSPECETALSDLRRDGLGFVSSGDHDGQGVEITGSRHGEVLRIVLRHMVRMPVVAAPPADGELTLLRAVVGAAPHLIWKENARGQVTWTNSAYRHRSNGENAARLFAADRSPATEKGLRRKLDSSDGNTSWFEEFRFPADDGGSLHFALPADPLVQAEGALRNFVQALAQTFAHLPIGLAVFDRRRKLALFNPALADLTGLSPETLSAQPSLFAFLDLLRGMRTIPETRDFKAWREKLALLERAAVDGTYEEDWDLPDGRTFRVTGRPHPDSAVAFLFEDITPSLSLQRKFRADLDLGQSVLDSRAEAIAVFTGAGTLALCNAAFPALWGFDPTERVAPMKAGEVVRLWSDKCADSATWKRFREYLASGGGREPWQADMRLATGEVVTATFSRLAQGATLAEFRRQNIAVTSARTGTKVLRTAL